MKAFASLAHRLTLAVLLYLLGMGGVVFFVPDRMVAGAVVLASLALFAAYLRDEPPSSEDA